jgi:hypothetical protein
MQFHMVKIRTQSTKLEKNKENIRIYKLMFCIVITILHESRLNVDHV